MKNCMVDLETMSTAPNAAIVAIGACFFDRTGVHDKFYTPVRLDSCIALGLHQSESTVDWWSKQDPVVRAVWDNDSALSLIDALTRFNDWTSSICNERDLCLWGNGAAFDNVILSNAYAALSPLPRPWRYYNDMCFRTMKNLFKVNVAREGKHHAALDDACHQANHLIKIVEQYELDIL